MRYRETTLENSYDPTGAKHYRKTRATGVVVAQTPSTKGNRVVKSISDVETPGFSALKKCGQFLPLNPVTIRTERVLNTPAKFYFSLPANYDYYGEVTKDPANPASVNPWWKGKIPVINQSLVDASVLAAMANAVGAKWDVLTFLAELSSTVDTIYHYGKKFNLKVLQGLQNWRRLRRNPYEFLRGEWLAYRYGIRPIISDIETAIASLGRLIDEVKLVDGAGYQEDEQLSSEMSVFLEGIYGDTTRVRTVSVKRVYRGKSYMEIDTSVMGNLQLDPIVTAYELVPYSFVVDRFVNFGAWLQTLTPYLRGEYAGTQYSVKTTVSALSTSTAVPNSFGQYNWSFDKSVTGYELEEYLRVPYSGGPPIPGFNPRVDLPFVADLVALFVKGRADVNKLASRR